MKDVFRIVASPRVHAVLFCGPEGYGPRQAAMAAAHYWLCDNPGVDGPCGTCGQCQSFERGLHPDLQVYEPVGAGNFVRISQIRRDDSGPKDHANVPVHEFARTLPLRAKRKVLVFPEADRLNQDASNSLLKVLEEPPPGVGFLLATTSPSRILVTVRSRCVVLNLPQDCSQLPRMFGSDADLAARIPLVAEKLLLDPETKQEFLAIVDASASDSLPRALDLAERLQKLALKLGEGEDGARQKTARAVEAFGAALMFRHPSKSVHASTLAETHRWILGNVQAGLALESLFTRILGPN